MIALRAPRVPHVCAFHMCLVPKSSPNQTNREPGVSLAVARAFPHLSPSPRWVRAGYALGARRHGGVVLVSFEGVKGENSVPKPPPALDEEKEEARPPAVAAVGKGRVTSDMHTERERRRRWGRRGWGAGWGRGLGKRSYGTGSARQGECCTAAVSTRV